MQKDISLVSHEASLWTSCDYSNFLLLWAEQRGTTKEGLPTIETRVLAAPHTHSVCTG